LTTITVTPFADSSFILVNLEQPKTLTELLNALPSAATFVQNSPLELRIPLEEHATIADLAAMLETLEPLSKSVVVSLAVKNKA
jgi:hypothetical protein